MIEGEYLLEAVEKTLRDNLTEVDYPNESIKLTVDERADALAGKEFISIFKDSTTNAYPTTATTAKDIYSVSISITHRLAAVPVDRVGYKIVTYDDLVAEATPSLIKRAGQIIRLLDGNWDIVQLANDKLQTGDCDFMTPLGFEGDSGQVVYVEEDHFFNQDSDSTDRPEGVHLQLLFSGAFIVRVKAS